MLDLLKRLVPESIKRRWRERRQREAAIARLLQAPPPQVPAASLRASDPRSLLAGLGRLESEWPAVRERVEALGIPELTGGVNMGDQRALYSLVRLSGARRVLEVGTLIGASTAHLALALDASSAGEPSPGLTTVDIVDVNDPVTKPWEKSQASRSPAALLRDLGVRTPVEFVTRDSLDYLASTPERFDLIFLDGLHTQERVYQEIPLAIRALRPDGLILLHDYHPGGRSPWPEERAILGPYFATEALKRSGLPIRITSLSPLPWPTKRGGCRTSLAVVTRAL